MGLRRAGARHGIVGTQCGARRYHSMFSHEGDARSDNQNRLVAGYLALVAGFVNSSGFVLLGTFTSHVTGNVGRLANDAASGGASGAAAAASALSMIATFFFGAFLVSVILESRWSGHVSRAYATALVIESLLLSAFTLFAFVAEATHPRVLDAEAALLCAAMGMQNGLVTRLSGAVVRTTHLTGVVTDLGIESARWFRYWRKSISDVARVPLVMGPNAPVRPSAAKTRLLATIALAFVLGALIGAFVTIHLGRPSMLLAAGATVACAIYAIRDKS